MLKVTVRRFEDPLWFSSLIERDIKRQFLTVESSKRLLEEKGVPRCYWGFLRGNCDIFVPGELMIGVIFMNEEDFSNTIRWSANGEVFHINPRLGKNGFFGNRYPRRKNRVILPLRQLEREDYRSPLKKVVDDIAEADV